MKSKVNGKVSDLDDKDSSTYPKIYDLPGWLSLFKVFLYDVKDEATKVTWPTRKEAVALAISVLILTIFFSIYLGLVDFILSKLVDFIIG